MHGGVGGRLSALQCGQAEAQDSSKDFVLFTLGADRTGGCCPSGHLVHKDKPESFLVSPVTQDTGVLGSPVREKAEASLSLRGWGPDDCVWQICSEKLFP